MAKKKVARKKKKAAPKPKVEVPAINLYGEAIKFATDQLRDGYAEQWIVTTLQEAHSLLTPENIQFILQRASLEIANEHARDRGSIISLHVKRYDIELRKALAEKHLSVQLPHIRRKMRIDTLQTALDIMFAKERVLQIHAKDTQIKIFNKLNAKIREKKIAYDLSLLTLPEKIEFLNLMMKAKRSQSELFSVQLKGAEKVITEDIEHVEVKTEDNITKIEQFNLPVPYVEPKPEKTIDTVTNKLRAALAARAAKDFKSKGAKEIAPNPIDLTNIKQEDELQQVSQGQADSEQKV